MAIQHFVIVLIVSLGVDLLVILIHNIDIIEYIWPDNSGQIYIFIKNKKTKKQKNEKVDNCYYIVRLPVWV